ncbi:hypothetical protein HDU96_003701, partial [Phlyctochytrium bullatum]
MLSNPMTHPLDLKCNFEKVSYPMTGAIQSAFFWILVRYWEIIAARGFKAPPPLSVASDPDAPLDVAGIFTRFWRETTVSVDEDEVDLCKGVKDRCDVLGRAVVGFGTNTTIFTEAYSRLSPIKPEFDLSFTTVGFKNVVLDASNRLRIESRPHCRNDKIYRTVNAELMKGITISSQTVRGLYKEQVSAKMRFLLIMAGNTPLKTKDRNVVWRIRNVPNPMTHPLDLKCNFEKVSYPMTGAIQSAFFWILVRYWEIIAARGFKAPPPLSVASDPDAPLDVAGIFTRFWRETTV